MRNYILMMVAVAAVSAAGDARSQWSADATAAFRKDCEIGFEQGRALVPTPDDLDATAACACLTRRLADQYPTMADYEAALAEWTKRLAADGATWATPFPGKQELLECFRLESTPVDDGRTDEA